MRDSLEFALSAANFEVSMPMDDIHALSTIISASEMGEQIDLFIIHSQQHNGDIARLAQRFKNINIEIPILFILDHETKAMADLEKSFSHTDYLQTPFEPWELIKKAENILALNEKH